VFAKRHELLEARMRVFCMTDDKEEKTLEHQEHFHEIAKSRDVEVLEGKTHYLEFFGNLFPITKSGDQLFHKFHAFRENRLPFNIRVKDPNNETIGRISFFREARQGRGEVQQNPICNLNISLPEEINPEPGNVSDQELLAIQSKYSFLREAGYGKFDTIHRADLRISDISNLLGSDWVKLARTLDIDDQDINLIISEYPDNVGQQAMVMLRLWLNTDGNKATGNALEKALKNCDREDIVDKCMFNVKMVTDNDEAALAQNELQTNEGLKAFKEEKNGISSKSLSRDYSIDVNIDENDYRETTYSANERLGNISEEMEGGARGVRDFLKQEEETSVYEREEQKYVAEEKEFASTSYQEEYQQESQHFDNNVIIQKSENKKDYLHEEMKKMSVEESNTVSYKDGDKVSHVTTESRMEEQIEDREMFNREKSETRHVEMGVKDEGTVLILTDSRTEVKEEYAAETHERRQFEQTEIVQDTENFNVSESTFKSEKFEQEGFEKHHIESAQNTVETNINKEGPVFPVQPQPTESSSYSDSEPESPRSPSPKVSPTSKSPSQPDHDNHEESGESDGDESFHDNDLMKETDQELLDEMIVKDVPESESSTDPVKKFEETIPPASIESIKEEDSDSE